jgi:hypothetical protein
MLLRSRLGQIGSLKTPVDALALLIVLKTAFDLRAHRDDHA